MFKKLSVLIFLFIAFSLIIDIASAVDLKNGLVAYWPLDENGDDVIGKSKGSLEGGAKWIKNGRIKGAVELDGTTGHVAISGFTLTTKELTAVAWLKGWKQANWAGIMCSRADPMTFWVGFTDQDTLSYVWNNNSVATWGWRNGPVIPQDEWAMIAITIDPKQATSNIYTDAKGLQSSANEIPHVEQTIADNLKIGRDECCGDNRHVKGIIDEVMIYKRALTGDEILQLAQKGLSVEYKNKLTTRWGEIKLMK